jgi:hypothetical protein
MALKITKDLSSVVFSIFATVVIFHQTPVLDIVFIIRCVTVLHHLQGEISWFATSILRNDEKSSFRGRGSEMADLAHLQLHFLFFGVSDATYYLECFCCNVFTIRINRYLDAAHFFNNIIY